MSTPIRVSCPSCQRTLKAGPEHLNKRVVCNQCRNAFIVRPDGQEPVFSPPQVARNHAADVADATVVTAACATAGQTTEAALAPRAASSPRAPEEPPKGQSREGERLATALQDTNAELERVRLTVKILQADLYTRAAEIDRLETARAAAASESTRLRTAMTTLEEARAVWERERQDLVKRAEAALAARDQAEKDKVQLAGKLRDALTRFGAAAAELEAERRRAEQLDTERRREDAERDRQQAEAARLRTEFEQQRVRREAERQAHHDAFVALRQSLAERLNSRTPAPTEFPPEPARGGTEARTQAHDLSPRSAGEPRAFDPPSDPFRELRSHLRDLQDLDMNEQSGASVSTRLAPTWRPDEP